MRNWTFFLALAVAAAQTPAVPSKLVTGEVAAIDASAKQFKVKGDDGTTYTMALQETTVYLRIPLGEKDLKKATKVAFSDVAVGDRLQARGPLAEDTKTLPVKTVIIMTKADVAKKQDEDRADWQKRGISGIVTAVNADAKEITINTHGRDAKPVVIEAAAVAEPRRYTADTVRFADAKPGSLAEVHVGDTVRALGDKNDDGTRFKAQELVSGAFQTIAATVVSVNAATGEVVVTDLKTKKPVTIRTNQNSSLRRLEERTAAMLARRMRPDAAGGPPGGPGGGPGGGSTMRPPQSDASAPGGAGPAGGMRGGPGGPGGGAFDLQQVLDRSPQLVLADLKKGDALIISSSKGADSSVMTAISLVAGVEPFLAAAPRTAGQVDLGSWSLGAGAPEQ